MKKVIEEAIEAISNFSAGVYILTISLLTYYIIFTLKGIEGYITPIPIDYLTIFIVLMPFSIPIHVNSDQLALFLISLYTIFAFIDITRKVKNKRPLGRMMLLASMIFVISVAIEYLQSHVGVETGNPETEDEYIYFLSAMLAPLTEEIGFRLTVIGLTSLILYLFINKSRCNLKDGLKAFLHPASIFSDDQENMRILYWMVILTSLLFGIAHILAGGWQIGKISLAVIAGLFLGYVFIEYGFTTSVLGHAYFNVYLLALYYFYTLGENGKLGMMSQYASIVGIVIYVGFSMVLGIIATIYYLYQYIDRRYLSKDVLLGENLNEI